MKRPVALIAAALLVTLVWFLWPRHEPAAEAITATSVPSATTPPKSPLERGGAQRRGVSEPPLEISHLADALNAPSGDIRADLNILNEVLANFRSNFPRDGNPVGNNAEITATLIGSNKLHYAVVPPNHPAINRVGELCDRWGTPFFFHAESGTKMGVRSAGPDKKMWTDDDVPTGP